MKTNILKTVLFIIIFGIIFFGFFYLLLNGLGFVKNQFGENIAFIALIFFAIVVYIIVRTKRSIK